MRVVLAEMRLAVAARRTLVNARVAVVVSARVSSLRVAASPPRFSFARACHAGRL
jgi:hypothetical protein